MREETIIIRHACIARNVEAINAGLDDLAYRLIDVRSISDAVEAGIPLKEVAKYIDIVPVNHA
jgi:hypothetical protein